MRDKERLKTIWEKFVYYNQIDPNLDELVKQSWLRSVFYGVNPHQEKGKKILSPKQLERCLRDKSDLLRISLPLMQSLYTLVQGSGFLVILCDENGLLLKMLGDPDTLFEAKNINFVEGANWSEEAMGTNAIGTCIKLDQPIQIYAAEHFSKICQSWTCSASPIHDPEGKIIGVLNMSGPFEKVHPHTLGMVVSAVEAIENQLKLIEKSKKNEIMQSYLEATINTLTEGVLIVTQEGSIIKTNEILLKMIKIDEQQIIGHKLNQVFGNEIMKKIAVAGNSGQGNKFKSEFQWGNCSCSTECETYNQFCREVDGIFNHVKRDQESPTVIAATNKNLEREVKKGSFRKDLFYRLNVIPIKIPSLRNRKEDIPLLVSNFTKKLNSQAG